MGQPSIFPTGATIYKKEKAYNGYTIYPSKKGALLIDMNGNEVKLWAGLGGFPNKILPGGYVLGSTGTRNPRTSFQDQKDLVQVDWDGNIVWKFDHLEFIDDEGDKEEYMARQHHDYQREGSPTGYFSPELEPYNNKGNTLILVHENLYNNKISDKKLLDDKIIEVDWKGEIIWSWRASDYFDQYGFDENAKNVLFRDPSFTEYKNGDGAGDWLHINSISTLGPNKWFDEGDERFNPDNIIWDARNANLLVIISKKTGEVVWKLGPDFNENDKTKKIGWIIGQHHLHMIPKGLPGAGDLLVYDNGGWGGYGAPNPSSEHGRDNAVRDYSRVLQINPVTLEITWQYTPEEAGHFKFDASKFYSPYISSAQRLPNGNTLITEGSDGRLIEVTSEHEIVWEYINPHFNKLAGKYSTNMIYRAYRVPYEWIPQLERPIESEIEEIDIEKFRLKGAGSSEKEGIITEVTGVNPNKVIFTGGGEIDEKKDDNVVNFCVVRVEE